MNIQIRNKDIIQSYVITTAKYDFSVYEKRILYRIIELQQKLLSGLKLNVKTSIKFSLFEDAILEMPIVEFFGNDGDQNYIRVKEAFKSLRNKCFELRLSEEEIEAAKQSGKRITEYATIGIIEKPRFDTAGYVRFEIQPEVYEALLDFSKGYRKIELKVAMSFKSVYSMRFYELFSGQTQPIRYSISNLRKMFNLEDKYSKINDFKKYVIDTAKKELDKKSPYSFNYKMEKKGRKFTSILFAPYYIPKNRDEVLEKKELQNQSSLNWSLTKLTINYLKEHYLFIEREIKSNLDLFEKAEKSLEFIDFLSRIKSSAFRSDNPKGYLIKSIRNELKSAKNKNSEYTKSITNLADSFKMES